MSFSLETNNEHNYSSEWSYDETYHWHNCTGEGCEEVYGKAEHIFSDWTYDAEKKIRTKECTVCKKTVEESIAIASTLDEFKAALAEDTEAIILTKDITTTEQIEITKSHTINLNEKTLKNETAKLNALYVKGEGVELTLLNGSISADYAAVTAVEEAKVTIASGKYSSKSNIAISAGSFDGTSYKNGTIVINNAEVEAPEFSVAAFGNSKLVINGGTFTSSDNAVIGTNGSSPMKECLYDITVNGGTFNGNIKTSGYIACGIYMANSGKVTLNGGTFNITGGVGVLVRSGELVANKTTINLTEKKGLKTGTIGDSKVTITTNSQIVVNDNAGYPGTAPKVSTNTTGYTLKAINGSDYTPASI